MAPSSQFVEKTEPCWHDAEVQHLLPSALEGMKSDRPNAQVVEQSLITSSWPKQVKADMVWTGSAFADSRRYTYQFSTAEVKEIEKALSDFKELGLSVDRIGPSTFPLPTLAGRLSDVSKELHTGRGFANLRGIRIEDYCDEDQALLFLGISSHIAGKRGLQDEEGFVFAHIRDASMSPNVQEDRPFRDSKLGLTFHTDRYADLLALQTRQLAASGGEHVLASSWLIYNELAATRPDVVELLARPEWVYDSPGQAHHGVARPLLFFQDGKIILNFVRYQLTGLPMTPRSDGLPDLTSAQMEALDLLESTARKHELVVDMKQGDLTYVNNLSVCHSRRPFENDETRVRHLVRMWLKSDELAWQLPEALQSGNDTIYGNDTVACRWNIAPQPRIQFSFWNKLAP